MNVFQIPHIWEQLLVCVCLIICMNSRLLNVGWVIIHKILVCANLSTYLCSHKLNGNSL